MKKKDKNQSILVATTLLLGSIFAIAIVINNIDVSQDNDLVATAYPNIQSKVEHSVDETLVPEAVQSIEMAEKDIIPNSVNIGSVEITSSDFAVAFKQARMLLGPNNTFTWNAIETDGRKIRDGIYFYTLEAEGSISSGKLNLIK